MGVLKSVQNKRQASSEFLLIASLDPTPPGKGKGLKGQQLGREAPVQAAAGDTGPRALAAMALTPKPPRLLLPSDGCSPASTGRGFLLSVGNVPLTGCMCPPAVALVLPPQPRQESIISSWSLIFRPRTSQACFGHHYQSEFPFTQKRLLILPIALAFPFDTGFLQSKGLKACRTSMGIVGFQRLFISLLIGKRLFHLHEWS